MRKAHGGLANKSVLLASLVPLLQQSGLQTIAREAANFILPAYPGLIVKDSYWRWPERNLADNALDFNVQALGLSFHNAMRQFGKLYDVKKVRNSEGAEI